MASSKNLNNLVINKVESQEVYDKLIAFLFNKIEQAGYEIK